MDSEWLPVILGILTCLLFLIYLYLTWNYGVLEKMGIPVKKPYFCFGSVPLQFFQLQYQGDVQDIDKYGKIWGLYEGRTPVVFIADPDMVKQILVKDFYHFHSPLVFKNKHPIIGGFLVQQVGEAWKMVRNSVTPIFSLKHLKGMTKVIQEKSEELVTHMKHSATKESGLHVKSVYDCYVIDVIAKIFFGTNVSSIKSPEHEFVVNCRNFFRRFVVNDGLLLLTSVFPFLLPLIDVFDHDSLTFLGTLSREVMDERKKDGGTYDDYVDILLKLEKELKGEKYKHLSLSDGTLLSQGVQFFLAGFNTTSTTLTLASYMLAKNPQHQERAYKEVKKVIDEDGQINRNNLSKMPYISAIVDETLRMFPPVVRLQRQCQEDWEFNGLKIPKGVVVKVAAFGMQNNSKYFQDADQFIPDRFLKGHKLNDFHPYSYVPFSVGPRNCLAMGFALEQLKITIAHMMYNFEFIVVPETQLKFVPGIVILLELLCVQDIQLGIQVRN